MKKILVIFFILVGCLSLYSEKVRYQPYVLAGIEQGDFAEVAAKTEQLLVDNGFFIAGKYSPMQDKNRLVICTTHDRLKKCADKIGGLTVFSIVFRFGLHQNKDNIEISYMNPIYWGNAFFRKQYPDVETDYLTFARKIREMFKGLMVVKNQPYGSEDGGLTAKKLQKYHFGLFMPYLDDVKVLAKKTNYDEVIARIEKNFAKKLGGCEKVFRLDWPEKNITFYGVALFGEYGEMKYWPTMEKTEHLYRHITALPFMLMVEKNRAIMLHGKYRVPLSFPDAGMGTFLKAMRAPGKTHAYMKALVVTE